MEPFSLEKKTTSTKGQSIPTLSSGYVFVLPQKSARCRFSCVRMYERADAFVFFFSTFKRLSTTHIHPHSPTSTHIHPPTHPPPPPPHTHKRVDVLNRASFGRLFVCAGVCVCVCVCVYIHSFVRLLIQHKSKPKQTPKCQYRKPTETEPRDKPKSRTQKTENQINKTPTPKRNQTNFTAGR